MRQLMFYYIKIVFITNSLKVIFVMSSHTRLILLYQVKFRTLKLTLTGIHINAALTTYDAMTQTDARVQ